MPKKKKYKVESRSGKYWDYLNLEASARVMAKRLSLLDGDAYVYNPDGKLIHKYTFGKKV